MEQLGVLDWVERRAVSLRTMPTLATMRPSRRWGTRFFPYLRIVHRVPPFPMRLERLGHPISLVGCGLVLNSLLLGADRGILMLLQHCNVRP
jgi:hypothetical protein